MGSLFQIKLNQLKRVEKRLQNLETDCDAIASDIAIENNRAKRQGLERQEAIYQEDLEKVAKQHDALKQKLLENFPEEYEQYLKEERALQDIIFLFTQISLEKVNQAYRSCFPEAKPLNSSAQSNKHEIILRQVAKMRPGNKETTPLVRLVNYLIQDQDLDISLRRDLQQWGIEQRLPTETLKQEQQLDSVNTTETYLMVKVEPRVLNNPAKGYKLNALLFTDLNPFESAKPKELTADAITVPPPINPNALGYSQAELCLVLGELINTCGAEHKVPLTDLIVQLFLPIELMSLPVEHWQLLRGRQCCGQRCKAVLVRSSERNLPNNIYASAQGDWEKYWCRLLNDSQALCTDTLPLLDPVQRITQIQGNQPQVLGCRFVEHHDAKQQQDFWEDLLDQGIPIAFWLRHLGLASNEAQEIIESVINNCSIGNLPAFLSNRRQQILAQRYPSEDEQFRKAPLCLLWDNPFRPFPSINYRS